MTVRTTLRIEPLDAPFPVQQLPGLQLGEDVIVFGGIMPSDFNTVTSTSFDSAPSIVAPPLPFPSFPGEGNR
jgi:hypothetical protein